MIFQWVPDNLPGTQTPDSNDKPPATVVIEEYCNAQYEADPMVGTGTGSCDNGMGSPLVETGMGNVVAGYRAGRRVRSLAGGQQVTVTFSPSASASCATAGRCSARVDYQCRVLAPVVTLSGYTHFSTGDKFLTGQEIKARTALAPSDPNVVLPGLSGVAVADRVWVAPGLNLKVFKRYFPERLSNPLDLFVSNDYHATDFNFYTAAGGKLQVQCNVFIDEPGMWLPFLAKSKIVVSVKPSTSSNAVVAGEVKRYTNNSQDGFGPIGLVPQGASVQVGAEVLSTFNDIPDFGKVGKACFAQMANFSRSNTRKLISGASQTYIISPANGLQWLDIGYPYTFTKGHSFSGEFSSIGSEISITDNPLQTFSRPVSDNLTDYWSGATANDSFTDYIMYLPPPIDGHNVMWVPIRTHEWSWNGNASRTETTDWDVNGMPSASTSGQDTDDHPTWVRIMYFQGFQFYVP